jgi:Xaa-Pro dipeptidase
MEINIMIRRDFLKAAGFAAAGLAINPPTFFGAEMPSNAYSSRAARARELMRAEKIDLLFALPSRNMAYLSKVQTWRSERLIALLLPLEGDPAVISPAFEEERLRRSSGFNNIATWKESEDPYLLTADLLKKMGVSRIGMEPSTDLATYWRLKAAVPKMELVDATAIFTALRIQKSPEELEAIRRAVTITLEAITATHSRLEVGKTELEIVEVVTQEMQKRGGQSAGGLVQFGPGAALPHGGPGKRALERDMVVLIDVGCSIDGYTSDISRTIFWGENRSTKYREVFNTVWQAQQAGVEAARPGVECQAVDKAARAVIEKAGYGKYFTHRLGHGMGMDGHEPPYLVEGNTYKLLPGNVVTIEPGIYLPGEFGVRIEDDFVVTEKGVEALSKRVEML